MTLKELTEWVQGIAIVKSLFGKDEQPPKPRKPRKPRKPPTTEDK